MYYDSAIFIKAESHVSFFCAWLENTRGGKGDIKCHLLTEGEVIIDRELGVITSRARASLATFTHNSKEPSSREKFHNARSLQENLARSAANQNARTMVAM